jgi:4-oxalocrotonate tautomerase
MPHINIKHFPVTISEEKQARLVASLTEAVTAAFGCPEGVISIALEPVHQDAWQQKVYGPEITGRAELLFKKPNY